MREIDAEEKSFQKVESVVDDRTDKVEKRGEPEKKNDQASKGSRKQRTESEAKEISTLQQKYQKSKRQYNRAIRRTKYESWQKFVTECGNEKPWGFVYKQQADKLKVEKIISTLRKGEHLTKTVKETAQWLLDTHIPNDLRHEDTQK